MSYFPQETKKILRHLNRLSREAVDAPSVQSQTGWALSCLVQWNVSQGG